MNLEAIAVACARECVRQQVGLARLADLLDAYAFAAEQAQHDRLPHEIHACRVATFIEPARRGKYRQTPVVFAGGGAAAPADAITGAMRRLFAQLDANTDPVEFVRHFLSIHPFGDGNGRTAFVLLNWIGGTLADPRPLPDLFGT